MSRSHPSIVLITAMFAACGGCDDEGSGDVNNTGANNGTVNSGTAGSNNATNNIASNSATGGNSMTGNQPFDPNETRAEYCAGDGPPIIVGDQGGTTQAVCTGDLAAVTFRYALCVCSDFSTSGTLTTDSFDSAQGPYDPDNADPGGAVGINGRMQSSKPINIGGTCWVGGDEGVSLSDTLDVAFQFHDAGRLQSSSRVSIADDAWIEGDVAVDDLTIGGTLHKPAGSRLTTDGQITVVEEAVDVPLPCDCEDLVDIAGFVELNEQYNHNEDIDLDPDVLSQYNDPVTLDLDCGRFFLTEINGSDDVTINITGRTAIFIGEDIRTSGSLVFNLDDDAELDLFIGGEIQMSKPLQMGNERTPSRARLYLAGENYSFSDDGVVAGNIYAPNAKVSASGSLEVFGSIFAGEISFSESLTIHYDTAILRAGESCPSTGMGDGNNGTNGGGGGCDSCKDCNNQACNDGVCGACEIAADCCAPLICLEGECVPYIQ